MLERLGAFAEVTAFPRRRRFGRAGRDFLCDLLERVGDDFRERRMIPRRAQQIEYGGLHCEWSAEGMDELAGILADDLGAEDPAVLGFGDDFYVSVVRVHQDGFSVIVEWIARDEIGHAAG